VHSMMGISQLLKKKIVVVVLLHPMIYTKGILADGS